MIVEGPAQGLLSSRLRCEMSCSFSAWLLGKREFLTLECVGELHRGKPLWKFWEATEESFFPGPPLMAFPISTPACSPQQDVPEPLTSSGSGSRAGVIVAPVYAEKERGEEVTEPPPGCCAWARASRSHPNSGVVCGTPAEPGGSCGAFIAEEPLFDMFYLGGLCPKLNLTPVASCSCLWSGWKVELPWGSQHVGTVYFLMEVFGIPVDGEGWKSWSKTSQSFHNLLGSRAAPCHCHQRTVASPGDMCSPSSDGENLLRTLSS